MNEILVDSWSMIQINFSMQNVTSFMENDRNMIVYKDNRHNQCDTWSVQMETKSSTQYLQALDNTVSTYIVWYSFLALRAMKSNELLLFQLHISSSISSMFFHV